jgi:hypothetical protein
MQFTTCGTFSPLISQATTTEAFEPILAKIRGLVGGWSEKMLSGASKEVLIKSVAQATTTYPMSCFALSARIRKKMTRAISNYWWVVQQIAEPSIGDVGRTLPSQNAKEVWALET